MDTYYPTLSNKPLGQYITIVPKANWGTVLCRRRVCESASLSVSVSVRVRVRVREREAGRLAVNSVGPVTERLLVRLPKLARWKNMSFCPWARLLTPNNTCFRGVGLNAVDTFKVECIQLCGCLGIPFPYWPPYPYISRNSNYSWIKQKQISGHANGRFAYREFDTARGRLRQKSKGAPGHNWC